MEREGKGKKMGQGKKRERKGSIGNLAAPSKGIDAPCYSWCTLMIYQTVSDPQYGCLPTTDSCIVKFVTNTTSDYYKLFLTVSKDEIKTAQ